MAPFSMVRGKSPEWQTNSLPNSVDIMLKVAITWQVCAMFEDDKLLKQLTFLVSLNGKKKTTTK